MLKAPKTKYLHMRISVAEQEELAELSRAAGLEQSELVRMALKQGYGIWSGGQKTVDHRKHFKLT